MPTNRFKIEPISCQTMSFSKSARFRNESTQRPHGSRALTNIPTSAACKSSLHSDERREALLEQRRNSQIDYHHMKRVDFKRSTTMNHLIHTSKIWRRTPVIPRLFRYPIIDNDTDIEYNVNAPRKQTGDVKERVAVDGFCRESMTLFRGISKAQHVSSMKDLMKQIINFKLQADNSLVGLESDIERTLLLGLTV